jgi:pimeloyl-ACP methyl ester carboxylesterase
VRAGALLVAAAVSLASGVARCEALVRIDTRAGVSQAFLFQPHSRATASLILFAGGHGNLGLHEEGGEPGMEWGRNNFLVRSREKFHAAGFNVAVVDAPSDQKSSDGMLYGFRTGKPHVQDIDAVIAWLRARADLPVWLVGTSRGTESAAWVAIHSRASPAGLVLTSSMGAENQKGRAVTEMPLKQIAIPVLVVAHEDDECQVTPPSAARTIVTKLKNSPRAELLMVRGGGKPQSRACKALSPHGFLGIEDQVLQAIIAFIRSAGPVGP